MQLFDRTGYRPVLTEQGRALLPRIRRVMDDMGEFRVQAQSIAQGVEAEVILAVENFLPLSLIAPALRQFHDEFPMVQLRINSVRPHDASQQLSDHRADLGLLLLPLTPQPELETMLVAQMEFVVVAAPDHPLAKLPPHFSSEKMRDHLQIVVTISQQPQDNAAYGIIGVNQWRVSDVRLRYELIKLGIGWGSMPLPMVEADVARGELVILQPAQWDSSNTMPRFNIVVARSRGKSLGPAGEFLMRAMSI